MKKYVIFILLIISFVLPACNKPHQSLTSKNPHAMEYNQAAVKMMRKGDFDSAKQYIDMALVLDPNYYGAYINLLNFHMFKKDYPSAIEACDHLIALAPDFAKLYVMQGILHEASGDKAGAAGYYERGLAKYDAKIKEKEVEGDLFERAFLYRLMEDEGKATAEFDRLKKLYPENEMLADLAEKKKDDYISSILNVR